MNYVYYTKKIRDTFNQLKNKHIMGGTMKQKKEDQRARLTQQLLKNALIECMQKERISKISVRELCERAGINRSTFYLHYYDIYDLYNSIKIEVIEDLNRYLKQEDIVNESSSLLQVYIAILNYIKKNEELFQILLNDDNGVDFIDDIMKLAQSISMKSNFIFEERTEKYIEIFGIGGYTSVLKKWMNDGMIESPEFLAEFIVHIFYHGYSGLKNSSKFERF